MTFLRATVCTLLFAAAVHPQVNKAPYSHLLDTVLTGTVVDSSSRQQLTGVVASLAGTSERMLSDGAGKFRFQDLAAGIYQFEFSMRGYRPFTLNVDLTAGEEKTLEVALDPEPSARVDRVNVEGDGSSAPNATAAIDRLSLGGEALKNLGTVLADDPFRALQALPGVISNDDFGARFFVRGADFSRVGIYLDGIKLHNAIHTLEGTDLSGSASSFNMALVRELDLHKSAYSEEFGDSSAGALNVHLRDGGNDRYSGSLSANLGTAGLNASGPFGSWNRCSWIAGFRKSYIQYLLARTLTDPSLAFGIQDEEGRLSCHAGTHNFFTLDLVNSHTNLDRSAALKDLGANSLLLVNQHSFFANLSWTYSPNPRLQIATHAAWMPDNFQALTPSLQPLGAGSYREKAINTNASWIATPNQVIALGYSLRAIRENGFTATYNTVRSERLYNTYRGSGILAGGYLVDSWTGFSDRLHLSGSVRWDHHSVNSATTFSPQAGASVRLLHSLQLQLAWGQYVQFPELSYLGSNLGSLTLLPARSTQAIAALEQTLPWSLRLKAELYRRNDRDLLFQSSGDPRVMNGLVFIPPANPFYTNTLRGTSRGLEFSLERTGPSGLNGWISYTYNQTWMHDGISNQSFPSNWDQRHTLNAYSTHRLRPSVNISAKWTWGSGLPAPGYFRLDGSDYYLSSQRNRLRLGSYQRLDLRVNKLWRGDKWRRSLYVEAVNLSDHANYRFGSLDGYNPSSGKAYVTVDSMFPILPTVGFLLER